MVVLRTSCVCQAVLCFLLALSMLVLPRVLVASLLAAAGALYVLRLIDSLRTSPQTADLSRRVTGLSCTLSAMLVVAAVALLSVDEGLPPLLVLAVLVLPPCLLAMFERGPQTAGLHSRP